MDSLLKMALIKSAKYDFAEVDLDKNNLFIGANGAGKTTLLRAILYFYTASSKSLGINSAKKISFLDYYFPYEESYIAYVYKKEKKYVLVTLYKSTTIKFRFCLLDSMPNLQELYTKDAKPIEHTQLWAELRDRGILSKTLSAKEYKDVLYSKRSKLKHYSLFEAKEYDGFVKTVANIFINNKVDSQAIKRVIVSSLNVEKEIDIERIKRQLSSFNETYEDINAYDKHLSYIEKLTHYLDSFEGIQQDLQHNLYTLFRSKEHNVLKIQTLQKEHTVLETQKQSVSQKLIKAKELYEKRKENLLEQIGVLKNKIKETKEKIAYYQKQDITLKQQEFAELSSLKKQLQLIVSQKEFLTKEYEDLLLAHQNRLQSIKNNFQEELNKLEKESTSNELEKAQKTAKIQDKQRVALGGVEEQFFTQERELLQQKSTQELKLQEQQTVYKQLKKEEFVFCDATKVQELDVQQKELTLELTQAKHKLEIKNQELQKEEYSTQKEEELLLSKEKASISKIEQKIKNLQNLLKPQAGTLLHSVYEHNLDLDKYIYFVKDEVLHSEIATITTSPSMQLFELNIEEDIPKSELQEELSSLQKEQTQQKEFYKLEHQKQQNSFKNRQNSIYREKRQLNEQIKELQRALEFVQTQQLRFRDAYELALDDFKKQKKEQEQELEKSIEFFKQELSAIQKSLATLQEEKSKKLSSTKAQFTKLLNKLNQEYQASFEELQRRKNTLLAEEEKSIAQQENLYKQSLAEKNIDVRALQKLTQEETLLSEKIDRIEGYKVLIYNYKDDKKEFIDKLKERENQLKEFYSKKEDLENLFKKEEATLKKELEEYVNKQTDNLSISKRLDDELKRIESFEESASMQECKNLGLVYQSGEEIGKVDEILDGINNLLAHYRENEKNITKTIGKLGVVFDTTLNIKSSTDPLQSAYRLQEFHKEKKIEHYKDLQVTMLNQIIKSSIEEYDNLMYHSAQIESLVKKITKLFREISIGVIEELSLRYSRTNNPVIERLSHVKELNAQNPDGYGVTLFNDGSNSKEMIKLLKTLRDTIELESVGSIDLEDSFVLEFRVVENGNDSRYQTSLDHIGSNGTDVLVKSMIYITMLHIFKSKTTSKELAIHVILDEIGILSQRYLKELIEFANRYSIYFINGAPDEKLIGIYKRVSLISNINNKSIVQELISS